MGVHLFLRFSYKLGVLQPSFNSFACFHSPISAIQSKFSLIPLNLEYFQVEVYSAAECFESKLYP